MRSCLAVSSSDRENAIGAAYAIFMKAAYIGTKLGAKAYYGLYADFIRSLKKMSSEEQQEQDIVTICDGIEAMISMSFGNDKIFDEIFANAGYRQERRPAWLENLQSAQC